MRSLRPMLLLSAIVGCAPRSAPPDASASAAASASTEHAPAPGPSCVLVAGWNDLHGHLSPTRREVDSGKIPLGGVIGLADEIAALRARGLPLVLLDAGDLFTGPLESSMSEGRPVVEAYRALGVDAIAIGNHEFDFGPEGEAVIAPKGVLDDAGAKGPRGALFARMREASFPFLAANVTKADGSPTGWPNHRASVVIERDGFKVGVVGYTTDDTPRTTLRPNVVGLSFAEGSARRVATEVRDLRAKGAAPVVLLAHASLEGVLPQELDDPADPRGARRVGEMARLLDQLGQDLPDIVVAGHRHAWMLGRLRGVPIVSASQHGVGLHVATFCREGPSSAPVLATIERRVAVAHGPPRSDLGRKIAAIVKPHREAVSALEHEAVTHVNAACPGRARTPSLLEEQIAVATLEGAKAAFGDKPGGANGTWVGFSNSGAVRASLRAGAITYGDVFAVFPFENTSAYCLTTRAGLERAIQNVSHAPSVLERFPFGIAGARVTMKQRADGFLDVGKIEIPGAPGKPDDPIFLALSDFLLWGGDDFLKGVPCAKEDLSSARIRDSWRRLLEREKRCDGPAKNAKVDARPN